jgi:hypothetical protein
VANGATRHAGPNADGKDARDVTAVLPQQPPYPNYHKK